MIRGDVTMRRRLVILATAAVIAPRFARAADDRYAKIRGLIKRNLHFSTHMTWAVDTRTIEAVRPHVTEEDIPVLVRMLGDKENVVGIGAQHMLATFGERAVPALEAAARSSNYDVRSKARDALTTIDEARRR